MSHERNAISDELVGNSVYGEGPLCICANTRGKCAGIGEGLVGLHFSDGALFLNFKVTCCA